MFEISTLKFNKNEFLTQDFLKRDSSTGVFLWNLEFWKNVHVFARQPTDEAKSKVGQVFPFLFGVSKYDKCSSQKWFRLVQPYE